MDKIVVNMDAAKFSRIKNNDYFGAEIMCDKGFIHASTIEQFPLIIPRFKGKENNIMVIIIDANLLESKVLWEYSEKYNAEFPHIYSLINKSAVIKTMLLSEYNNNI